MLNTWLVNHHSIALHAREAPPIPEPGQGILINLGRVPTWPMAVGCHDTLCDAAATLGSCRGILAVKILAVKISYQLCLPLAHWSLITLCDPRLQLFRSKKFRTVFSPESVSIV